jgi:drug/metabolite transporter (DMT)-like permease
VNGYAAAAVVVLIWAAYPVATRAGVTGSFAPHDLMLLRFGVGALLFLPWVILHSSAIRRDAWLRGIALTLFQGAGMAGLVIVGLQYAPAHHAAALGPGIAPAWVTLLGYLFFSRRPSNRAIAGAGLCALGVTTLVARSTSALDLSLLTGDAMFIAASALGSLYVLQMRSWGLNSVQAAAIVTVYSALAVVPWYLWSGTGSLALVAPFELAWQIAWQGVLIGCVALVALNHAIARLGPERASTLVALVPALSAILGIPFLGEIPTVVEVAAILAISTGVALAAFRGYGGSPASLSAAMKRSA